MTTKHRVTPLYGCPDNDQLKELVPGAWLRRGNVLEMVDHAYWAAHKAGIAPAAAVPLVPAGFPVPIDELRKVAVLGIVEGLYDYQLKAIARICYRGDYHAWLGVGGGKTRVSMLAAAVLARRAAKHESPRVLYVTESGLLVQTKRAIDTYIHGSFYTWLPPSRRRKKATELLPAWEPSSVWHQRIAGKDDVSVMLVGYSSLPEAYEDIEAYAPHVVIWDENHTLANPPSWDVTETEKRDKYGNVIRDATGAPVLDRTFVARRTKQGRDRESYIASKISRLPSVKHRIGATGTGVPDRIRGLWVQLDRVEPWAWGSFRPWTKRYCNARFNGYGFDDTGESNREELDTRLKFCAIRVSTAQIRKTLPAVTREVVYIQDEELVAPIKGTKRLRAKLQRIGDRQGGLLLDAQDAASRKREAVARRVKALVEAGHKVLVLTGFQEDAEALAAGIPSSDFVHGGIPNAGLEGYQQKIDAFWELQGGGALVGTWDSIGVGFNIQCVTYLVFAQLPISPYKLEQGEGRAVRPGMQAPVVVQYMVAEGTFDVRLRELLLPKADSSAYLTHSTDLSAMAATIADKSNQEKEASVMAGWLSWTEGVGDYE